MTTDELYKLLDEKLTSIATELATIKQDSQTLHLRLARMETQRQETITTEVNLESLPAALSGLLSKINKSASHINQLTNIADSMATKKHIKSINSKLENLLSQLKQLTSQTPATEQLEGKQPDENPENIGK